MNRFPYRIGTASHAAGFRLDGYWVWCGSVARGDDGRYHMFASIWPKTVPFSPNWLTNSRVVRAVADTLDGPYAYADEVLPPRGAGYWDGYMTHNPTIHRHGDTWLLYYTGTRYAGDGPTDDGPRFAQGDPLRAEARANQRIGLATAPGPEGPWRRLDAPILEPRPGQWDGLITTNPAPVVHEDGSVLLYYKSCRGDHTPILYGIARAEHWRGPYQRAMDGPILWNEEGTPYEDATVWHQGGGYHMLFKDMTDSLTGELHGGCYGRSDDGLCWTLVGPGYSRTLRWVDGTAKVQGSLERPQVFLEAGEPVCLFAATADGPGGFWNAANTWNQALPLEKD